MRRDERCKKVTAIVLALSMLFCFTACGNKADSNESDTSQNGAVASSEGIPSGEPEPEPDPKTMPRVSFYRGCTGAWRAYRRGKRQLENLLCHTG